MDNGICIGWWQLMGSCVQGCQWNGLCHITHQSARGWFRSISVKPKSKSYSHVSTVIWWIVHLENQKNGAISVEYNQNDYDGAFVWFNSTIFWEYILFSRMITLIKCMHYNLRCRSIIFIISLRGRTKHQYANVLTSTSLWTMCTAESVHSIHDMI